MEIATSTLSCEILTEEILRLPGYLSELGVEEVNISYGFGSGIHIDLWWKPMKIHVVHLKKFLEDSIARRILVPGSSDLHIESQDKSFEITVCHQSDFHIKSDTQRVLHFFQSAWSGLVPVFYERRGNEWKEIVT